MHVIRLVMTAGYQPKQPH